MYWHAIYSFFDDTAVNYSVMPQNSSNQRECIKRIYTLLLIILILQIIILVK